MNQYYLNLTPIQLPELNFIPLAPPACTETHVHLVTPILIFGVSGFYFPVEQCQHYSTIVHCQIGTQLRVTITTDCLHKTSILQVNMRTRFFNIWQNPLQVYKGQLHVSFPFYQATQIIILSQNNNFLSIFQFRLIQCQNLLIIRPTHALQVDTSMDCLCDGGTYIMFELTLAKFQSCFRKRNEASLH